MKRRMLVQLFLVEFVIFLTGMGLLPLLPIYAQSFGAGATAVGLYLSTTYVAITAGTLVTDRLSRRVGPRRLFMVAGGLGMPSLILMGQATHFWQIVLLTALIWFSGGIGIAQANIFTGLCSDQKSRGKSFSLTFLAMPTASLVSGISVGALAEAGGYPLMFNALSMAWAFWPIIAFSGRGNWPEKAASPSRPKIGAPTRRSDRSYASLLIATLLSASTVYLARLATSYAMHNTGLSDSAISSTSAVGGLTTIPLAYIVGAMSDRFGRRLFLIAGYLVGGLGAMILASAGQLWQFWTATALVFASLAVAGAVAPAMAADLLPVDVRSRGLSRLGAMRNIAGIIGFAAGGMLMDIAGAPAVALSAVVLSLAAAFLLMNVRVARRLWVSDPRRGLRSASHLPRPKTGDLHMQVARVVASSRRMPDNLR